MIAILKSQPFEHCQRLCMQVALAGILTGGCTVPVARGLPRDETTWSAKLAPYAVAQERDLGIARQTIPDADRARLEALLQETRRIIVSPAFRRHLAAYGDGRAIKVSPTGPFEDGRTLLASYLGLLKSPFPLSVVVADDAPPNDQVPGTTGIAADKTRADMHLTAKTMARWSDASNPWRKSCAINTTAHELTHAVVDATGTGVYKDRGFFWMWLFGGGDHIVSYTVGTVAQCTWLEEGGEDYHACVARMGTKTFSGDGCD